MNRVVQTADRAQLAAMRFGVYLLGFATIAAGTLDLIWGDFDPGHQPLGGLGYDLPGRAIFAYLTAIWMIAAGTAVLWRRSARMGALATAVIYFFFGLLSLPHFYTLPHRFGFHLAIILGVIGQVLLQVIMVAACLILYSSSAPATSRWLEKSQLIARWSFGLAGILTGIGHLTNTKGLTQMIPKWMPLSASFWVVISGIGFLLAGIAILSGVLNILASRLLTLMLLIFEVALVPILFGFPHKHEAWGASAYNLTVAGAVWIFAVSIAGRKAQSELASETQLATAP